MARFDSSGRYDDFDPTSGLGDRLPPQNLDAERSVLGACLMDGSALEIALEMLKVDDFYRDAHQVFFRAIRGLASQQIAVDAVTVADELTRLGVYEAIGGDDTLHEIAGSVPHHANVAHHADIVRQKAVARKLVESHTNTIRDIYSQTYTADQLVDRATREIASIEGSSREEEYDESLFRPWPAAPDPIVWSGLAGRFVKAIEPHSESDPVAVLGQLLVCVGNMIGRKPHWVTEATRHRLNLFLCVVGDTAQARKGGSWGHVNRLLYQLDEQWTTKQVMGGLSTGEGLIHQVRDPLMKRVKVGDVHEDREIDAGVQDKRVLFMESEFGGMLTNMGRDGNNLSAVIRQAWESGRLGIATKNTPVRSTDAHISIIGHITEKDLKGQLTQNDAANGLANRFLWVCARRSKQLPHGGQIHKVDFRPFIAEFNEVVRFVDVALDDSVPLMRDAHANQLWEQVYGRLTSSTPGLFGSIISRAAPQVMRLASIFAILDQSSYVTEDHLKAGLAFWDYCEASASWIFGAELGDVESEKVIKAIRSAGVEGLTRTQINRRCFSGKKSATELDEVLIRLVRASIVDPPSKPVIRGNSKHACRWVLKDLIQLEAARLARLKDSDGASP